MSAPAQTRPVPSSKVAPARRNPLGWTTNQLILVSVIVVLVLLYPLIPLDLPGVAHEVGVSTLADTGIFILLALGLNIVVGYAGLLDLGYVAFFAIGSYTYALLASGQFNIHLSFWLLMFIAAGAAALCGALLGAPTLRLRGDYLAIVTLGFGEIVPAFFLNLQDLTGGTNGVSGVDHPVLGIPFTTIGFNFGFTSAPYYYLMFILVVLAVIVISRLRSSRLGRAWMAIREDELAAAATGINTTTTKLLAFALGAAFSGFAGSVYAAKLAFTSPQQFDYNVSVFILCMIILGGMGSIPGVILGTVILYIMQSIVLIQLPNLINIFGREHSIGFLATTDFSGLKYLIYGIALVGMMLLRPEGLIPSARRKAELHADSETASRENSAELYDVSQGQQAADTRGGGEL